MLHLVASVISEPELHENMIFPWRGECDSDQCLSVFSGLTVYYDAPQIARHPYKHILFSDG